MNHPDTLPRSDEHAVIAELEDQFSEQTSKPDSAPQERTDSISILELMREVQIDETSTAQLANQARSQVNLAFHKAEVYGQFMPAVASAIAHQNEPALEPIYPTAAQIKEQSRGARLVSGFLGFFSSRWAERFDGYLERKARQKLARMAHQSSETINTIGEVERPKEQFVDELALLYQNSLQHPSLREGLLQTVQDIANDQTEGGPQKERRPLSLLSKLNQLSGLTRRLATRSAYLRPGLVSSVRTAAPEIMQGIERFLKQQSVEVPPLQSSEKSTLARRLVQRFSPHTLDKLPQQIESALTSVYNVLPADGQRFKDGVYELCKAITVRAKQGESSKALTQKILQEAQELLQRK